MWANKAILLLVLLMPSASVRVESDKHSSTVAVAADGYQSVNSSEEADGSQMTKRGQVATTSDATLQRENAELSAARERVHGHQGEVTTRNETLGCPRGAFTVTSPHVGGWRKWPTGIPAGAKVTYLGSLSRYADRVTQRLDTCRNAGCKTGVVTESDGLKIPPTQELVGPSACWFSGQVKFPNSVWDDGDTLYAAAFKVELDPPMLDTKLRSEGPMLPDPFQRLVKDKVIDKDGKVNKDLLMEAQELVPDMIIVGPRPDIRPIIEPVKNIVDKLVKAQPVVEDNVISVYNVIPPLDLFELEPAQAVVADIIVREIAKPDPLPPPPQRPSTPEAVTAECHKKPSKVAKLRCCWQFCELLEVTLVGKCLDLCQKFD